jgi:hypothetical protein
LEHDLFGNPVSTFPDHRSTVIAVVLASGSKDDIVFIAGVP